jgi:glycosyltransferase involved in cell wall biosynthesis
MAEAIFSVYPITKGILQQLEQATGVAFAAPTSFGELKREPVLRILRILRRVRSDAAWIAVSDHNYQPYLPLLLILGALTGTRRLKVVDFSGKVYETNRWRVFLREPLHLAIGSVKGFLALGNAYRAARALLSEPRIPCAPISENPRVAYLKTNLWFGVQAGGSIGHVAGVANGFSRLGSKVDMYAVEDLPMLEPSINHVRIRGTGVVGLPLDVGRFSFQQLFVEQATELMSAHRPDLIYQRNCLANFAGVVLSRQFQLPLVIEYNGSEVWISEHWGLPLKFASVLRQVEEINLRHAHLVVVVSEVLRQELLDRGIPEECIVLYPNCVEPTTFDPNNFTSRDSQDLRKQWGISPQAVLCTFLGTFGQWHGVEVLAEAIRKLVDTQRDWLVNRRVHFMLVGDGPLMPKVRALIDPSASRFVTLTGLVQQDQAPRYLAASDILLSPHVANADGSRFFGSPTKLFEYMAMGKGIVASDLEQIGHVLQPALRAGELPDAAPQAGDRALAVLTKPGDVDELIGGIRFMVEREDWRVSLGKNARRQVLSKYTWRHHVEAILAKLMEISRADTSSFPAPN